MRRGSAATGAVSVQQIVVKRDLGGRRGAHRRPSVLATAAAAVSLLLASGSPAWAEELEAAPAAADAVCADLPDNGRCGGGDGDDGGDALAALQKRGALWRSGGGGSGGRGGNRSRGTIYGHPSPDVEYPAHEGFTLMLVEEFNEPLDLDSDPIWTWSDGGLSDGQVRFMKDNIMFQDGSMVIEMRDEPSYSAQLCSHAEVAVLPLKPKTSGELRARYNMFRYGRYEVRMKAPSVQPGNLDVNGNYVASMFVFRDGKFNHWREMDFEITGDSAGRASTNVLFAEKTWQWRVGMSDFEVNEMPFNLRADFHTYTFEWLPDRISWYIDGQLIRQKTAGYGIPIPELSVKVMMNLWMFNEPPFFGGQEIWNDRFPMRSEYDWFRFYKWDGDTQYPCEGMKSDCLAEDDWYLAGNNPCDGIKQTDTVFGIVPCVASCGR